MFTNQLCFFCISIVCLLYDVILYSICLKYVFVVCSGSYHKSLKRYRRLHQLAAVICCLTAQCVWENITFSVLIQMVLSPNVFFLFLSFYCISETDIPCSNVIVNIVRFRIVLFFFWRRTVTMYFFVFFFSAAVVKPCFSCIL